MIARLVEGPRLPTNQCTLRFSKISDDFVSPTFQHKVRNGTLGESSNSSAAYISRGPDGPIAHIH